MMVIWGSSWIPSFCLALHIALAKPCRLTFFFSSHVAVFLGQVPHLLDNCSHQEVILCLIQDTSRVSVQFYFTGRMHLKYTLD